MNYEHIRGLTVTLGGSVFAVAMALIDQLRTVPLALAGPIEPPAPAALLGFVGLITAFGGIGIQAYDKAIARRKLELDHQYRLYLAKRGCDEMSRYANSAYAYIIDVRDLCAVTGVKLPPNPGPPPVLPECPKGDSDEWRR